jgi:hypothetical protein
MMTFIFLLVIAAAAFWAGWGLGVKEGNQQASNNIERLLDKAIEADKLDAQQ